MPTAAAEACIQGHASCSSTAWSRYNLLASVVQDDSSSAAVAVALQVLTPGKNVSSFPPTRIELPQPFPACISHLQFSPDGTCLAIVGILASRTPRIRLLLYTRLPGGMIDQWSLFHDRYLYREESTDMPPLQAGTWRSPSHVRTFDWVGPKRKWYHNDDDAFVRTPPRGPTFYGYFLIATLDTEEIVMLTFQDQNTTPALACFPLSITSPYSLPFETPKYFPEFQPFGPQLPQHFVPPLRAVNMTHASLGLSKNNTLMVAFYSKLLPSDSLFNARRAPAATSAPPPQVTAPPPEVATSDPTTAFPQDPNDIDMTTLDSQFLLTDLDLEMDPFEDLPLGDYGGRNDSNITQAGGGDATGSGKPISSSSEKQPTIDANIDAPDVQVGNTIQMAEIQLDYEVLAPASFQERPTTPKECPTNVRIRAVQGVPLKDPSEGVVEKDDVNFSSRALTHVAFLHDVTETEDLVLLAVSSSDITTESGDTIIEKEEKQKSSVLQTWSAAFSDPMISDVFSSLESSASVKSEENAMVMSKLSDWTFVRLNSQVLSSKSCKPGYSVCREDIAFVLADLLNCTPGSFYVANFVEVEDANGANNESFLEVSEIGSSSLTVIEDSSIQSPILPSISKPCIHLCQSPNRTLFSLSISDCSGNSKGMMPSFLSTEPHGNLKNALPSSGSASRAKRIKLLPMRIKTRQVKDEAEEFRKGSLPWDGFVRSLGSSLAMTVFNHNDPADIVCRLVDTLTEENDVIEVIRQMWKSAQLISSNNNTPVERSPAFMNLISLQYFVFRNYGFAKERARVCIEILHLASSARTFYKCRNVIRTDSSSDAGSGGSNRPIESSSIWPMLGVIQWITRYINNLCGRIAISADQLPQINNNVTDLPKKTEGGNNTPSISSPSSSETFYDPNISVLFHPVTFSLIIQVAGPVREFGRVVLASNQAMGSGTNNFSHKADLEFELAKQIFTSLVDHRSINLQKRKKENNNKDGAAVGDGTHGLNSNDGNNNSDHQQTSMNFIERVSRILGEVGKVVGAGWQGSQLEPQMINQRDAFITGRLPAVMNPTRQKVIEIIKKYCQSDGCYINEVKQNNDEADDDTVWYDYDDPINYLNTMSDIGYDDEEDEDEHEKAENDIENWQTEKDICGKGSVYNGNGMAVWSDEQKPTQHDDLDDDGGDGKEDRFKLGKRKRKQRIDMVDYSLLPPLMKKQPLKTSLNANDNVNMDVNNNTIRNTTPLQRYRQCTRCHRYSKLPKDHSSSKSETNSSTSGPEAGNDSTTTNRNNSHNNITKDNRSLPTFENFTDLHRWSCPCGGLWVQVS